MNKETVKIGSVVYKLPFTVGSYGSDPVVKDAENTIIIYCRDKDVANTTAFILNRDAQND